MDRAPLSEDGRAVWCFVKDDAGFSRYYPYHVVVEGKVVFQSRLSWPAMVVSLCVRGEFWRTPVEKTYPNVLLCDFSKEEWHRNVGA
jgi:hypothetical protein